MKPPEARHPAFSISGVTTWLFRVSPLVAVPHFVEQGPQQGPPLISPLLFTRAKGYCFYP